MRDRSISLPIAFQDVAFAAGATPILNAVSLAVAAGPPTVLLGPNGSGKTQRCLRLEGGRPRTTVARLLQAVGLAPLADRPARRLSGGEQQRLALARALARDPEVLFLDEPTASLDPAASKAVEDIILRTAERGVKIVMATHDLGQARRLAGDIVLLANGGVVERAAAAAFFSAPATATGRRFLAGELIV